MALKLVNLTPHDITIAINLDEGKMVVVQKSGVVARLEEHDTPYNHDQIPFPIIRREFKIPDLSWVAEQADALNGVTFPEVPLSLTIVIVSLPLLMSLSPDVITHLADKGIIVAAPDTGKGAIRDEKGQIVAVKNLITR